jgi:coenzyme PQQ synthesis protein D (PqqD)
VGLGGSDGKAISPGSVIVASQDQVSCDLDGEAAILDLKAGVYYGLDEVGAAVWKLVQVPRTVVEVRNALMEEYDVNPAQCQRDLVTLFSELAAAGLVEVCDGPGQ